MEHYIGVDLHKAFFQACALTALGERTWEERFPTSPEGFARFRAQSSNRTDFKTVGRGFPGLSGVEGSPAEGAVERAPTSGFETSSRI